MVKVLVMSGYGINCETESAYAFKLAGGESEIVHINDLISGKKSMSEFQIMMFPGGFSYGDDTGSGQAFADKVRNNLWGHLVQFIKEEKLILGVCNGFQILSHLGLFSLDGEKYGERVNALVSNDSARYICKWVEIEKEFDCVFTKGITSMHLPIAHGEGKFFCDKETLERLRENGQIVFRYVDNPNGALDSIAGICDKSGRILGMMPHPERAIFTSSKPDYHKLRELSKRKSENLQEYDSSNLKIFKNAVEYFYGK